MLTLYAASAAPLEEKRLYERAYGFASPARRAKADAYLYAEDKTMSLAAEVLLRRGLRDAGTADVELTYGEYGKPYLAGGGTFFSLAHSGGWALCTVADREVGCDVELMRPVGLKVAERFFDPAEFAEISASPDPLTLFFRCWTIKESYMKATGLGMNLLPGDFRIVFSPEIRVEPPPEGRSFGFREFTDIPGCAAALCAEGGCGDAELRIIDLAEELE